MSLLQRLASWSTLRLWTKSGYYVPQPKPARKRRILNAVRPRARKK